MVHVRRKNRVSRHGVCRRFSDEELFALCAQLFPGKPEAQSAAMREGPAKSAAAILMEGLRPVELIETGSLYADGSRAWALGVSDWRAQAYVRHENGREEWARSLFSKRREAIEAVFGDFGKLGLVERSTLTLVH
jgi:hypothetical protein